MLGIRRFGIDKTFPILVCFLFCSVYAELSCTVNDDCYKWRSLDSHCCRNVCCNWFKFVYRLNFDVIVEQNSSHTMVYERPTVLTILLILLILLIAALFILYICCLVCACKCLQCLHKKTTMTNGTPLRPINGSIIYRPIVNQMQLVQPSAPVFEYEQHLSPSTDIESDSEKPPRYDDLIKKE